MKKALISGLVLSMTIYFLSFNDSSSYKDGDIIFQTTSGATGKAIQLATHSKYKYKSN